MPNQIVVVPDFETMSQTASEMVLAAIARAPSLLICAATGATPTGTYQRIAERGTVAAEMFSQIRFFKLDEWCGLTSDDPASCEAYLQQHLVRPLKITAERYIAFDGAVANAAAECDRVASALSRQGPVDLAIIGIGTNGHIGFNEPDAPISPHAHVSELALETRQHSMLLASRVDNLQQNIRYGLTLGMSDLLQARQVIIVASGPSKQLPLRRMLNKMDGEPYSPASHLWKHHPNAVCICDQAAMPTRSSE